MRTVFVSESHLDLKTASGCYTTVGDKRKFPPGKFAFAKRTVRGKPLHATRGAEETNERPLRLFTDSTNQTTVLLSKNFAACFFRYRLYVCLRRFRRGRVLCAPHRYGIIHRPEGHCQYPRTRVILSTGIFSILPSCLIFSVASCVICLACSFDLAPGKAENASAFAYKE